MKNTIGVILAAGRGSRMKELTKQMPKCLLKLAGRPLLHWQLDALRCAGLERILVVRGYQAEMISGNFETVDNILWAKTNMIQTLLCAFSHIIELGLGDADILVSYADIVYHPEHVQKLLSERKNDISLAYDTEWQSLWQLRNDDPLADAETFLERDGILIEIGAKPQSLEEIHGQYMGLLKFTPHGQKVVGNVVDSLPRNKVEQCDMTFLIRNLLAQGTPVHAIPVHGKWCECDTPEDICRYERRLTEGPWKHDWRS